MIISHISLKNHLPIIQKVLLIHYTTDIVTLDTISNILSLTLKKLKYALSKLYSVLTFISRRKRLWEEPFPGFVHISFYHAFFMEFLLDKTRSEETLVWGSVLCLFKDLYVMNGISHGASSTTDDISCCKLVDERISRVWGLLHIFLDETFPSSECLMFQNELFYNALCKYVSKWRKGFEPLLEVIGEFEDTLEEFWLFFIDWIGMVYNLF